jgi:hypothetical protein
MVISSFVAERIVGEDVGAGTAIMTNPRYPSSLPDEDIPLVRTSICLAACNLPYHPTLRSWLIPTRHRPR